VGLAWQTRDRLVHLPTRVLIRLLTVSAATAMALHHDRMRVG
jgi:hypothetical protein